MNIFGKKERRRKTFNDIMKIESDRVDKWRDTLYKFKPRLERLNALYPTIIRQLDLVISKRIILKEDLEVPDEFLCSCKLLGMRVKNVKREHSYSDKHDFYYVIEFHNDVIELDDECK